MLVTQEELISSLGAAAVVMIAAVTAMVASRGRGSAHMGASALTILGAGAAAVQAVCNK
jgi:hypothetical protein